METGNDDPLFGNPASDLLRGALEAGRSRAPRVAWEPPTAEQLAAMLPQYEIETLLGCGGMGAVYKGRQISLDRPVAIKILSGALEDTDHGFTERFKNEARAMAKLNHPGIVGVYDFGETSSGLLYIVMEFVEGTDVARMIADHGRMHSDHAMAITAHVCDALAYAHQRGIIHRDIKPANIMVGYDGVVKVADFGLAKFNHSPMTGLTQSGMAMGTLYYMAPEALTFGTGVDERADIYAVGVMLFQMLTGKLPHGLFELPSLQVPGLDPRYDAIIGKALREDRERRYPSALDMRHDLDAILTQPVIKVEAGADKAPAALPSRARPSKSGSLPKPSRERLTRPKRARSSGGGMTALALALVLAAAAFFYFLDRDQGPSNPSTTPLPEAGDWIDLLTVVDPPADTVSGKWTRVAGGLQGERLPDGKGAQVLQLPYEPPEEYDFRVVYTTMEGNAEISQILSAFDRQFIWGTASGSKEKWSGFNMIDGKPMMQNGAGVKLPAPRELNRRYESLVEVRRGRVTGYVDGEKLLEWQTDYSDLSMDPPHTIPNPRALGLGIWWSKTVFHEISVREVTGKGKVLSEPDAAPVTTEVTSAPSTADPAQATKDQPFVNSLGMKFVPVPGTRVLFCIHETRRQDFAAFAAESEGIDPAWMTQVFEGVRTGHEDNHPVTGVDWTTARRFCLWLGERESRVYRLPTDEEWSHAVGIGSVERRGIGTTPEKLSTKVGDTYPWAGGYPPVGSDLAGNLADEAWHAAFPASPWMSGYNDGFATTAPVMSFKPNKLGLFDMSGNVREWVEDWMNGARKERVLRGVSFVFNGANRCLSSARFYDAPPTQAADNGFRCVLDLAVKPDNQNGEVMPPQPPSPPSPPEDEGFTPLLNSGHHDGWQTAAGGEVAGLSFADGVLTINPSSQWPDYYWYMKRTYADFVLRLDYKIATQNGNSGIPLRVQVPSSHPRKNNYECDVSNSPDPLQASGAFMGVKAPIARAQKEGEWNELEITAIGQRYRVMLNGVLVNDFTGDRSTRGYIGLQLNVATVQYRNIRIKDLTAAPPALPTGPTAWTDTKGRSLTATFKAIASGNVLLDIGGKITPVPLNTLSAESQKLARDYQHLAEITTEPDSATKDKPFVNSLGMRFVPVPGTNTLFCIHETRKADYAAFFATTPGVPAFWHNPSYEGAPVSFADDHPVCNIRWQDCRDFCQWLSRKEGRTYRLPTDSEWSFAAGIGDREDAKVSPHLLSDKLTGEFPWGKEWPPPAGAGNLGDTTMVAKFPKRRVIPGYTDGFATTAPVMSFSPNQFGLHDLSGNVWEFCEDWFDETQTTHVIRGLNFDDGGDSSVRFLSSHRGGSPALNRHPTHGFRIVLERPVKPDATVPSGTSSGPAPASGSSSEDPAMAELLAFEKELRSHTWVIPDRNWELRFENDHRAPIDERVYTTRWHWWITGPRSLHVQFAAMPAAYDPNIGAEYIFDKAMKSFTNGAGKPTGVRGSALAEPAEADLGRSFAPDYAPKLGGSLRPQFQSR